MAPHDNEEELFDEEPPAIDPYDVLGVTKDATADDIKTAYRKAALKNHPDKAPADQKETATAQFQSLVFAYSILSDPVRRTRYDRTGSTLESIDGDDFSWTDFYRDQFRDVVTSDAIAKFAAQYKGSTDERDDVLRYYEEFEGKWGAIYQCVMLSDPLEDEDRFRGYIEAAIENGDVKKYPAYSKETKKQRERRMKVAAEESSKEAKEAEEYAEELGVKEALFGKKGKKDKGDEGLKALIQNRGKSFMDNLANNLEAKYAQEKRSKGKKGKRGAEDEGEPSEEAFQAAAAKLDARAASRKKAKR